MQMGMVWDVKISHPEYSLKGKVLLEQQWDYLMSSFNDEEGVLPFAVYDVEYTSRTDDRAYQKGDKISVEVASKAFLHCRFDVGMVNLTFNNVTITDIDDGGNLYAEAHLLAMKHPINLW